MSIDDNNNENEVHDRKLYDYEEDGFLEEDEDYDLDDDNPFGLIKIEDCDVNEYNGIGNLVILDRSINRNIKDNPVNKKVTEYKKSKYVSVRFDFLERYEECQEWGIKEIKDRKEREIKKIEAFMTT